MLLYNYVLKGFIFIISIYINVRETRRVNHEKKFSKTLTTWSTKDTGRRQTKQKTQNSTENLRDDQKLVVNSGDRKV